MLETGGSYENVLISLRSAYEIFQLESDQHCNSYDWYRQRSQRNGSVVFGRRRQLVSTVRPGIRAFKLRGQWMLEKQDLDAELEEHRLARVELQQVTDDYRNRILYGKPGSTMRTSFGSYTLHAHFHKVWRSDAKPWKETGIDWFCSRCWQPALLVHDNPECHTCSDWGSCERDCTLSEVSCKACNATLKL